MNRQGRIAFLGPEGSYGHVLAGLYFGEDEVAQHGLACQDNTGIILAVGKNQAYRGVVPIENTTGGSVVPVLDELWTARQTRLAVYPIAERTMAITHCLIGPSQVDLGEISKVYSHGQGLVQCRGFLGSDEMNHPELVEVGSTSGAVEMVIQQGDHRQVAIGSARSAERFGGLILRSRIEDKKGNRTRFLILGRRPAPLSDYAKTIVMFTVDPEEAGTLVDALQVLKAFQLSLDMVATIPQPTDNGRRQYRFYAEFYGHRSSANVRAAIAAMRLWTQTLHVIGSFAASDEVIE